jgi:hypothetical protein
MLVRVQREPTRTSWCGMRVKRFGQRRSGKASNQQVDLPRRCEVRKERWSSALARRSTCQQQRGVKPLERRGGLVCCDAQQAHHTLELVL